MFASWSVRSAFEIAALRASLPALISRQEIDAEFVQLAGALMQRQWFKIIDTAPPASYVRSWDLSYTTKTTSDYTVGAKVALLDDGTLVVAHVVRGRWEWPEAVRMVSQTAQADGGAVRQGIETVGAQVGFLQTLQREPILANIALSAVEVHKDKLTRALPLIARAEQGKVALVRGDWNQAFLDEACSFPSGAHDDAVDAVTGALQMLATSDYFVAVV
jgi:predicted phage terminase large subunit-like protein